MKFLIVSFALAAVAVAAPQYAKESPHSGYYPAILRQAQESGPDGSHTHSYETENGISAAETAIVKGLGPKGEAITEVEGFFQYTAPDGTPIQTKYRAGPDGFYAEGAHLPVPPAIPEAILRSIAYNAAHPEEYKKEGEYVYKPQLEQQIYLPVTSTTYKPVYDIEYSTTPKPFYTPTYLTQPGYPQKPLTPTYFPKVFTPTV